jgi:hypothetical protein
LLRRKAIASLEYVRGPKYGSKEAKKAMENRGLRVHNRRNGEKSNFDFFRIGQRAKTREKIQKMNDFRC